MSERSLEQWVDYIQTLHYREIELSLERVRTVFNRLLPQGVPFKVISVAGTNGKGSTVELLSSIYDCAGHRVGKFTSPHLIDFAERYTINRNNVSEPVLLAALTRIEEVRADVPITYFEFGLLLAIEIFSQAQVDVAIMEVGLGGRLDAVNILDADIAIITSIAIDHTDWLGDTIDKIAYEKAGIARPKTPCIVGMSQPPVTIREHCEAIGADLQIMEQHFSSQLLNDCDLPVWQWQSLQGGQCFTNLPLPYQQEGVQLFNASLALQAVDQLAGELAVDETAIKQGLHKAQLLARCQILSSAPLVILDVSHNESSVQRLSTFVKQTLAKQQARNQQNADAVSSKVVAVCGMLKDKEVAKSLAQLSPLIDEWYFANINNPRGADATYLQHQLNVDEASQAIDSEELTKVHCFDQVEHAYDAARAKLSENDCLVVFGSFYIAGDILLHLSDASKAN